jgi:DNA excision repair protein ERCC-2
MRKMKQAIGRLIRTETDRGMAVILDSRVSRYAKQLDARLTDDPAGEAVRFFDQGTVPKS